MSMTFPDAPKPAPKKAPMVRNLSNVLEALRPEVGATSISMEEIMARVGRNSFPAVLLLISVMIVSPISGIPLLPSVFALIVVLVALQAVFGRDCLWLPKRLVQRRLDAGIMSRGIAWLERPVQWLEERCSGRWAFLTTGPLSILPYAGIIAIALTWPPLSLVPFSATLTAVGMALLSAGLVLRDGVFVVVGFAWSALVYGAGVMVFTGIF